MISPIYGALLQLRTDSEPEFGCTSQELKDALKSMPLSQVCPLIADSCDAETLNLLYIRHCTLESAWLFYPLIVPHIVTSYPYSLCLSSSLSTGLEASPRPT